MLKSVGLFCLKLFCHNLQFISNFLLASMFNIEYCICGIAPMEDHLVALSVNKDINDLKDINASRPQLQVIETQATDGYCEISSDILTVRQFASYRSIDYHLECLPEEGLYFIICPKDIVIAKPREEDDHVTWLVQHKEFEEALEIVKNKALKKHTLLGVGILYLNFLLQQNPPKDEKAAKLCPEIFKDDIKCWQEGLKKFEQIHKLRSTALYLPKGEVKLETATYEAVLHEFLKYDHKGFLETVRAWPSNLYKIENIMKATLDILTSDPKNETLLEALAALYGKDGKYDKALTLYIEIGNKDQVSSLLKIYIIICIRDDLYVF